MTSSWRHHLLPCFPSAEKMQNFSHHRKTRNRRDFRSHRISQTPTGMCVAKFLPQSKPTWRPSPPTTTSDGFCKSFTDADNSETCRRSVGFYQQSQLSMDFANPFPAPGRIATYVWKFENAGNLFWFHNPLELPPTDFGNLTSPTTSRINLVATGISNNCRMLSDSMPKTFSAVENFQSPETFPVEISRVSWTETQFRLVGQEKFGRKHGFRSQPEIFRLPKIQPENKFPSPETS